MLVLIVGISTRNRLCIGLRREKQNVHMMIGRIILVYGEQNRKEDKWSTTILLQIKWRKPNLWSLGVVSLPMM
jgi:hypothetical protein